MSQHLLHLHFVVAYWSFCLKIKQHNHNHGGKIYKTHSLHFPSLSFLLFVWIWQHFEVLAWRHNSCQVWWENWWHTTSRYQNTHIYRLTHFVFILVISIKSISSIVYEGLCQQSSNVEDFKKCVDDLRKPSFINKIQFKSFEQSYELEASGVTDFIYPGKHSITEEMSPKLFLNKVWVWITWITVFYFTNMLGF